MGTVCSEESNDMVEETLCSSEELKEGNMIEREMDGAKVLLIRYTINISIAFSYLFALTKFVLSYALLFLTSVLPIISTFCRYSMLFTVYLPAFSLVSLTKGTVSRDGG
jgi:hypothetical protein